MWIFLSDSFLSIVEDQDNKNNLLVRARAKGDIEKVFPEANVSRDSLRDYLYRTSIPKERVAVELAIQIIQISYEKFKPTVLDVERHRSYLSVWSVMAKYQDTLEPGAYQEWLKHRNEKDPRI